MLTLNFKHIFTKLEKSLKTLKASNPENVLIMFDNLNTMANGCYVKNELDFIEVMNEIVGFSDRDPAVGVAIGINRDLFEEDS